MALNFPEKEKLNQSFEWVLMQEARHRQENIQIGKTCSEDNLMKFLSGRATEESEWPLKRESCLPGGSYHRSSLISWIFPQPSNSLKSSSRRVLEPKLKFLCHQYWQKDTLSVSFLSLVSVEAHIRIFVTKWCPQIILFFFSFTIVFFFSQIRVSLARLFSIGPQKTIGRLLL